MYRINRILAAAVLVALIAAPAFAQAKNYPSKTIECYAPSGAGGSRFGGRRHRNGRLRLSLARYARRLHRD